jgi:hypothetical protein
MSTARPPGILNDTSARTLVAGDLEALFLPSHGMLCASLRHRGAEILRRVENLEAGAARGSTAGIPLLHHGRTVLRGRAIAWRGSESVRSRCRDHQEEFRATAMWKRSVSGAALCRRKTDASSRLARKTHFR